MAEASICTVYVQNLEERVKPEKLTGTLRALFEDFGHIVDIVAKKNVKAKGQAFIVYNGADAAHRAIAELQGFEVYDKPMNLALARTRSDATVLQTGNEEDFDQHKRRRLAEKDKKRALEAEEQKRLKRPAPGAVPSDLSTRPAKIARGAGLKPTGPNPAAVVPDEYLPPNRILFVQKFPEDYDSAALTAIFARFDGFREVRMVPGRKGIAFVEYDTEQGAIAAKENTAGMALNDGKNIMQVTYQRQ